MPSRKACRSASRRAIATSARRYLAVPSARERGGPPHAYCGMSPRPSEGLRQDRPIPRRGRAWRKRWLCWTKCPSECSGALVCRQSPHRLSRRRRGPVWRCRPPWWKNILVRRRGRAPRPKLLAAPLWRIPLTESGLSRACFRSYCLVFRRWLLSLKYNQNSVINVISN